MNSELPPLPEPRDDIVQWGYSILEVEHYHAAVVEMTAQLTIERDAARADVQRLRAAAYSVLAHLVGRLPIEGYLRDNDYSRAALGALGAALATTEKEIT